MFLTLDLLGGLVAAVEDGSFPLNLEVAAERCVRLKSLELGAWPAAEGIGGASMSTAKVSRPSRELQGEGDGFQYLHLRHDGRC